MARLMMALAITGVLATTAAAAGAQRYRDGYGDSGSSVTVFADDDFKGRSMPINGAIARMGPTGMEDKISSIGVDSGRWEICTDDDFRGHCEIIDHSVGRLSRMGMEDNISSIRPAPPRRRYR